MKNSTHFFIDTLPKDERVSMSVILSQSNVQY